MKNKHSEHGRGDPETGPDEPDCPCRTTEERYDCANSGCGFCTAVVVNEARAAHASAHPHANWCQSLPPFNANCNCGAAHASEQGAHKDAMEFSELVWFACLVEPFVADHWSGKKDELSQKLYKACLRIRPITDKYQKNIPPTPATASEKGCTCDTTGEICRPSHDCPIHGIDKPDPASTGKYKHEYADHLPATDATDHAATPSGGGEWTATEMDDDGDGCFLVTHLGRFFMESSVTAKRIVNAHNATLRDCGNDKKRLNQAKNLLRRASYGVEPDCRLMQDIEQWFAEPLELQQEADTMTGERTPIEFHGDQNLSKEG